MTKIHGAHGEGTAISRSHEARHKMKSSDIMRRGPSTQTSLKLCQVLGGDGGSWHVAEEFQDDVEDSIGYLLRACSAFKLRIRFAKESGKFSNGLDSVGGQPDE